MASRRGGGDRPGRDGTSGGAEVPRRPLRRRARVSRRRGGRGKRAAGVESEVEEDRDKWRRRVGRGTTRSGGVEGLMVDVAT